MKYIDIDKTQVPYQFEIRLKEETFQFEIYYNASHDYFTVNLYKDHNLVRYGEKIVFGRKLFEGLEYLNIPKVDIIPADTTKRSVRVDYENINEDVFLYVLD